MATLFGEAVTGSHIDDISCQFQYNNSENDATAETTGTGFTSNANSMARIGVNAGGVGTSVLTSRDSVRYRPGHEEMAQYTARFVGAGPGVTHFIGIGNGMDRVGFGTKDGAFGAWFWEGTNQNFMPQAQFARDRIDGAKGRNNASGFDIDPTKFNLFMPAFGWLGIAPIMFNMHGGVKLGWLTPHYLDFINQLDEPHLQNPSLPLIAEVVRTSGDGEAFIETSSWRAGVVAGREEDNNSNRRFQAVRLASTPQTGAGLGTHVMTLSSKELFQSKTNHVKSKIDKFVGTNNFNKDVVFETWPTALMVDDGTGLAFSPNLVDNDADNSVLQFDLTSSNVLRLPGEDDRIDIGLVKADAQRDNPDVKGANIFPGDTVTITLRGVAGGSGTSSLQAEGFELF
jgi:hypothetical protein